MVKIKQTNFKTETATQRKRRLEKKRQNRQEKLVNETAAEKRARLEKKRQNREKETQTQIEVRLLHDRHSKAQRHNQETEEERNLRRESNRISQSTHRANETEEERLERLERVRQSQIQYRANETVEERVERLEQVRQTQIEHRANETAEERAERLERARQYQVRYCEAMRIHRATLVTDLQAFHQAINVFANQICEVCKKRCYPNQVSRCVPNVIAAVYLPTVLAQKDTLLLCHRCKTHLTSNKNFSPSKAYWNNLDPGLIPPEISELTDVEVRLLARIIVFAKLVRYEGRFGQYGFNGQVILFAQDVNEVTELLPNMLPRSTDNSGMIVVTEHLENIRTRIIEVSRDRLNAALRWLIQNNPLYQDVTIDQNARLDENSLVRVQEQRHTEQPQEAVVRRIYYVQANSVSKILRSSWHQGDLDIFPDTRAGKQCCAMVLANILRARILSPNLWSKSVLDHNLLEGDEIYKQVLERINPIELEGSDFLCVNNFHVINDTYMAYGTEFKIIHEEEPTWFGSLKDSININTNDPQSRINPLKRSLELLFENHQGGILIANNKAIGVLKNDEKFYFTDSHSCGPKGQNCANGKACVIECNILDELVRVCKRAVGSKNDPYTLDYIDVQVVGELPQEVNKDDLERPAQEGNEMDIDNLESSVPMQVSLMMPVDYAQPAEEDELEVSDNINEIRRKARDNIVNIGHEPKHEEFAWYNLFPYGINGLTETRPVYITPLDYFQQRVLGDDLRFQSKEYLFYALSMKEFHNVKSMISTCAKKIEGQHGKVEDVHLIMQNLRGSAAYWRSALNNLIAQIRCLGPPTYFVTFSCNDLNWKDMRKALLYADGRANENTEDLSINDVQKLIEKHPVTVARQFTIRFNALKKFMKNNHSIFGGRVEDFWYRVEMQNRGSPHIHMLVWIKDHPSFETPEGIEVLDEVITYRLPDEDDEMHDLVLDCQKHKHRSTCRKHDHIHCRFAFPRQPSETTRIISHSSDDFLRNNGRICILKRRREDQMINNYNPTLLKFWEANMDIQPCGSNENIAYYVAKYISKNEPTELDSSIIQAIRLIQREETDISRRMFRICMKILNERRVSATEAAYRLCHLPLRESSRKTIFVNTRIPEQRYRVLRFNNEDNADGFCDNIFDRYIKRPRSNDSYDFDNMCLMKFAMLFEPHYNKRTNDEESVDQDVDNEDERRGNKRRLITLDDQKRSKMVIRNKPAVVRVPYFTMARDPQNYFYSLLVQYVPFRDEVELLIGFDSPREAFLAREEDLRRNNEYMELYRDRDQQLENAFNQVHAFELLNDPEMASEDVEEAAMPEDDMSDEQFQAARQSLNINQRELYNKITLSIQQQLNGSEERVKFFVTGGAGTGKSFTLKTLREQINRCYGKKAVKTCALTGVAARLVQARLFTRC
jgi:hypothetical protein